MTWNYRVVRRLVPSDVTGGVQPLFAVHEAYYDAEGRCWGITERAVSPSGDTLKEFRGDFAMYNTDVRRRPVLNYEDVPEPGAINPADEHPIVVEP
jgi:hypothetical protein